ncbi:hypothetical protein BH20CHL3_BH20CHL3_04660 [soil metagenome]
MSSLLYRTSLASDLARQAYLSRPLGPIATIRSFFMMLWLDIKGCQGIFLLPLMVGMGLVFASTNLFESGVVLWKTMNFATVQSYMYIAPVTAGLAAWTASRDRRRHVDAFIESAPGNPLVRDLSVLAATAGWGLLGYAIIAACYAALALQRATWGGFDADLALTGALGIVLAAAIGVPIGRFVPGRFSALLAVAVTYATVFLDDIFRFFDLFVRLPELTPMDLAWRVGQDIYRRPAEAHIVDGLIWLTGLIVLLVAVMALARRRLIAGSLLGVGAVTMASIGGSALMTTTQPMFDDRVAVLYEPTCAIDAGIEVCVHPAYEPLLDETMRIVNGMTGPLVGLDGVRTEWLHGEGPNEARPGAAEVQFRWLRGFNPAVDVAEELFPIVHTMGGGDSRPVSQLVILYWLSERAGIGSPSGWSGDDIFATGNPDEWAFGYPAEVPQELHETANSMRFEIDDAALVDWQAEIESAVDQFSALSHEEQRVWLEENWQDLRAGALTLDDLP